MRHRNSLQGYKMSFSTGGLFHNESIEITRLHEPQDSWEETLLQAMEEGKTLLPKAASNRRTTREIINRISCLTEEERDYLVGQANRQEQAALLWLATCRAYRLIREFAVEVIRERHMSYQLDLPQDSFDRFFDAKAELDERLDAISPSTLRKLRQVLFRIMREADIITDENQIRTAYLSPHLRALIARTAQDDLAVFPGVAVQG